MSESIFDLCMHGDEEGVRGLIAADLTAVNSTDKDKMTPLLHAAKNGKSVIAQLLLQAGADKEARDKFNKTPLLHAADKGFSETVEVLLQAGADKEARNLSQCTPLIVTAGSRRNTSTVQILLKAGADKDARDNQNCSSLHNACSNNCIDTVKVLLEAGADPHVKNNNLETPLDKAKGYNYPEIVAMLEVAMSALAMSALAIAPTVPAQAPTGDIFTVCQKGDERDVQAWIDFDGTCIHATDPNNFNSTPLHLAVMCGQTVAVQLLLKAGAATEAKDKFKKSPLLIACKNGLAVIAQILLEGGADITVKDGDEKTPLHFACNMGNISTVQVLVQAGADVHAKDKNDKTPLDISREKQALYANSGHEEIIALLETAVAIRMSAGDAPSDVFRQMS